MASGGISGVAVALASAGGVLLYAGFQGQSPLQALRDITSGKTKPLEPGQVSFTNDPTTIGGATQVSYGEPSALGGRIAAAAITHRGEKYSQAKRWEVGFSDCSSFVGKALKDAGVTPPGGSTTVSYRTWKKLKNVARGDIQTGDILCGPGHVAIALDASQAIGQQNKRHNVQVDSIDSIMFGQPGWVARRYVTASKKKKSGGGAGSYDA
ncbi:NlpC/P60 family protein [Streptomyces sp. NPDC090073]|uniref:NlpC/P60 family protein n=1 Tax=Streptomyces sp. NPDC090073 TaxID=3365936 RepID=UPI0037F3156A